MSARAELQAIVYRIALKSQKPAAQLERVSRSTDGSIGGNRPSGGTNWHDDHCRGCDECKGDYMLKSAEYFARRAREGARVEDLLAEAKAALRAYERTPLPKRSEPEYGSPQWKRWVAESDLPNIDIARKFNVSRQYVHEVRQNYGKAA